MALMKAVLQAPGEDGTLVLTAPDADVADNPPVVLWNPSRDIPPTRLDVFQSVFKWREWEEADGRLVDVPVVGGRQCRQRSTSGRKHEDTPTSSKETDLVKTRQLVMDQQRQWAEGHGFVDPKGYVPTVTDNLFAPLSDLTQAEFEAGKGGELTANGGELAKMRPPHSSAALVCNVFDYWRRVDKTAIGRALDLEEPIVDVRFEAELDSRLPGTKPTLDLLLTTAGPLTWGVESKFTEPFGNGQSRPPFRESYFKPEVGRWNGLGLPACQKLAEGLRDGVLSFKYLDAPQLLKHTLGLRTQHPEGRLILLWYKPETEEAEAFTEEIRRFGESVDEPLGFRAITYQEVFVRLAQEPAAQPTYLDYLRSRYFPGHIAA